MEGAILAGSKPEGVISYRDNEVIGSRRTWGVRGSLLFSWSHLMTVAVSIGCPLRNLGLGTMREGDTSNL